MSAKIMSAVALAAVCLFGMAVMADSDDSNAATGGTTGECTWSLDGTKLTISGAGAMGDYTNTYLNLPWGTGITEVVIGDSVTEIGSHAFYGCGSLTKVTVGSSVTSVGECAFYECTSLDTVDLGSVTSIGKYAFYKCTSLDTINLPGSLTVIGDYAFFKSSSLTSVDVPDSVVSVGTYAFGSCTSLARVSFPATANIGSYVLYELDVYGNDHKTVLAQTTGNLAGYVLTGTGDGKLNRDHATVTYTVNGVREIAEVEYGTQFTLCPSSSGYIFRGWFTDSDLTRSFDNTKPITTPTEIYAKMNPYGITGECTWELEGTVLFIDGTGAMANYRYGDTLPWGRGITEVYIRGYVTSVGYSAFYQCPDLVDVRISAPVTSIGYSAFYQCTSLSTVEIPNSVTSIGDCAFLECTSLTRINFPSGITSFGSNVLYNVKIYGADGTTVLDQTAENLVGHIFEGSGDGKLYLSVNPTARPTGCTDSGSCDLTIASIVVSMFAVMAIPVIRYIRL